MLIVLFIAFLGNYIYLKLFKKSEKQGVKIYIDFNGKVKRIYNSDRGYFVFKSLDINSEEKDGGFIYECLTETANLKIGDKVKKGDFIGIMDKKCNDDLMEERD